MWDPKTVRKAERRYAQQLRKIARYIDTIVKSFDVNDPRSYPLIVSALNEYAGTLHHWAQNTAGRIMTDVALRDQKTWLIHAKDLSRGVRDQIRNTDIGAIYQKLMDDQVTLIKSLPLDAAQRVHDLATRTTIDGGRASEVAGLILATGHVTKSRANLIARTEISRAQSNFTEARAKNLGSQGYIWRTSEDPDVRSDHKELNGTFHKWDNPPIADQRAGVRAHPGCIYNCRCYAEPVVPDDYESL
ncbi:phage head morphogenesis protein [Acinetobacter sp. HY1485]|uniref:phage head morphogenesis protein n=1 Tax=Acinetobacter sp. HY1485 TaxID=2970918 RepID=UPI0022B99497|nr:minor capsid protein [Acinetobacter sp. HY1485]